MLAHSDDCLEMLVASAVQEQQLLQHQAQKNGDMHGLRPGRYAASQDSRFKVSHDTGDSLKMATTQRGLE